MIKPAKNSGLKFLTYLEDPQGFISELNPTKFIWIPLGVY